MPSARSLGRSPLFNTIKEHVLGKQYDLSLAFLPQKEMRAVTRKTKGKDKVSNVLAFPLSKTSGEILICKSAAKPYTVEYLFIHGLLHLKGHRHGGTMERIERQTLKRFDLRAHE
jgi:ssRNA-specific RNase YbeY (16S rRNA maturation enzyme)